MKTQPGSARDGDTTSPRAAASAAACPARAWKRMKTESSMRAIGASAAELGNPVGLPGLAAVVGEGLLELEALGGDVGEDEAHEDHPVVQRVLGVELPSPVLEAADHRQAHRSLGAVGVADAPLAGLRSVDPEAHS